MTAASEEGSEVQMEEEEREGGGRLRRIVVAAALLVAAMLCEHLLEPPMWLRLVTYLPAYLVAGYDVLAEGWENATSHEAFDEDFLMSVATVGALVIGFLPGGEPQFAEAVFTMLFFQVGELFEDRAEGNSRRSVAQLMDIRPDSANVERGGEVRVVSPADVEVGEVIVVRPGERVPLDGVVVEGRSALDTVALTGESVPRDVAEGGAVVSGCVNVSGALRVRVTKPFGESTATRILDLVENASENKSRSEGFITRFAHVYTPIVVYAAVALAILPPLLSGDFAANLSTWLIRALTFLVVSCPCALVISVPLSFFGGIGGASKRGILVKGSNYLEALAKTRTVVFDKTGTLTHGVFAVDDVHASIDRDVLLHYAAHAESLSTHPIAKALRDSHDCSGCGCPTSDITEIAGQGITANVNGHVVAVGNTRLMESVGAAWRTCEHDAGTVIHVAIDGGYAGHVVISDQVKDDSAEAIRQLRAEGVTRCVMLTGDREEVAADVARRVGVDEYHSELLPADKVADVERLLAEKPEGTSLAFVGDGINDAPVLARSDVGIAMGAMGSDAAIEAADVVLMDDQPSKIAVAIRIARRTLRIAHQNIVFSIGVKVAILVLAAFGMAPMWLAVLGDTGVMILAVLNSMRALR